MDLTKYLILWLSIAHNLVMTQTKKQVFACEGSSVTLSCEPGKVINIVRANFGRFSNAVCPSRERKMSTHCIQPTTLREVKLLCGGRSSCTVPVSTNQFGDPCPDTPKYLQLLYNCEQESAVTTEATMVPLWLMSIEELASSFTHSTVLTSTSRPATTETPQLLQIEVQKIYTKEIYDRSVLDVLGQEETLSVNTKVKSEAILAEAVPYSTGTSNRDTVSILIGAIISSIICTLLIFLSFVISHIIRKKRMHRTMNYFQDKERSAYSQYITDSTCAQSSTNYSFFLSEQNIQPKIKDSHIFDELKNYQKKFDKVKNEPNRWVVITEKKNQDESESKLSHSQFENVNTYNPLSMSQHH